VTNVKALRRIAARGSASKEMNTNNTKAKGPMNGAPPRLTTDLEIPRVSLSSMPLCIHDHRNAFIHTIENRIKSH